MSTEVKIPSVGESVQEGMIDMDTFVLKSGSNKGHRRIWIEGGRLINCGLPRGMKLYRYFHNGFMVLSTFEWDSAKRSGKHTIAGTVDRPILDLCGQWVSEFIGDNTHFEVTPTDTGISIKPVTAKVTFA